MIKLKNGVNQIIENLRNEKIIKSGLETKIIIASSDYYKNYLNNINLADFLVCSAVSLNKNINGKNMLSLSSLEGIKVFVEKASGQKCQHCWKISEVSCERKNCPIK